MANEDVIPDHLTLPTQQLHIWIAPTAGLDGSRLAQQYYSLLDENERARYQRFHFDDDRMHYLAAHALLRVALSRYAAPRPEEWRFEQGPQGKPAIAAAMHLPALQFNLSHTKGMVACALANGHACGIDVECHRALRDLDGVAEAIFSDTEIAYLQRQDAASRLHIFFTFWTLKEAYIKATGQGLFPSIRNISFELLGDRTAIRFPAHLPDHPDKWFFARSMPTATHSMAVACAHDIPADAVVYRYFDFADGSTRTDQ